MKPEIWRLTLDTNPEDCNLSCIMCEEHSAHSGYIALKLDGKKRRMPKEWLEDIFLQAKEVGVREIIPSTMGEPLLYKHFDLITQLCRKHGISMNLTTNGTFPGNAGKTIADWADAIIPITSDIKISWNGHTAETAEKIMQGLDHDKAVKNLGQLLSFRNEYFQLHGHYCCITLQLTFMQNNMHELAEIVKWASSIDVDRIKGHHLWTHFPETEHLSFRNSAEGIEKWNEYVAAAFDAADKFRKPDGRKVLLENFLPLENKQQKEIPYAYACPFLGKELWISATGKISPCCAPDEQRNTLGSFGNIHNNSIKEVIESADYRNFMANYKEHPLCKQCNMRLHV